ncbi:MAG TPA: GAF domain-containing protein [Chryseolinea sp.]
MRAFLYGLRIRIKLLAAFGSILLLSVVLIALSGGAIEKIIYFKSVNEEVDMLKLRLQTMDLATKEFVYEGFKSPSFLEKQEAAAITTFNENQAAAKELLGTLRDVQSDKDEGAQRTMSLDLTLDSLQTNFEKLVDLLKQRGFKDYGLEGSLRTAIHAVENSGFEFDKVSMLMLRRHEKDFFLRKDLKYQQEFNARFETFKAQLEATTNKELITFLDNYRNEFNRVVEIEKQIGLTESEGIRGQIKNLFVKMRPQIETIHASMKERNEIQISRTQWLLWTVFIIQTIAGFVMAIVYAGLLTKAIKEIRNGMQKLAAGIFPDKLLVKTTEEIGETKIAFNQFIDRLRAATQFAEHLGAGNSNLKYDDQYNDDVLAKSLISAHDKLQTAESVQKRANWINEGAAQFNEIFKNDAEDIKVMGERIIHILVTYLKANQGALYVVSGADGASYLERIATYAYGKKKFVEERIDGDAGLLGQCVLEGQTIYLKDLPKDFVKITSGLGEATPRNVVVVPLKTREKVMGVVELASFGMLDVHHIEFIERVAESIASILYNKQSSTETKRLLEESQQRAHSLAQQEEEMRQNSEELQATQEEMERQRLHLQQEIKALKEKLKDTVLETL